MKELILNLDKIKESKAFLTRKYFSTLDKLVVISFFCKSLPSKLMHLIQGSAITKLKCHLSVPNNVAAEVTKILIGTNITHLDLANNQIEDTDACDLANVLPYSKVTHLNLGNNAIESSGISKLINTIKWTKIVNLNLERNLITSSDVNVMINEVIKSNLMFLNLGYIGINPDVKFHEWENAIEETIQNSLIVIAYNTSSESDSKYKVDYYKARNARIIEQLESTALSAQKNESGWTVDKLIQKLCGMPILLIQNYFLGYISEQKEEINTCKLIEEIKENKALYQDVIKKFWYCVLEQGQKIDIIKLQFLAKSDSLIKDAFAHANQIAYDFKMIAHARAMKISLQKSSYTKKYIDCEKKDFKIFIESFWQEIKEISEQNFELIDIKNLLQKHSLIIHLGINKHHLFKELNKYPYVASISNQHFDELKSLIDDALSLSEEDLAWAKNFPPCYKNLSYHAENSLSSLIGSSSAEGVF